MAIGTTTTDNELIVDSTTATADDTTTIAGKEYTTRIAAETASRNYETTSTSIITPTVGDDTIISAHFTWDMIPANDYELRFHYLSHKK
ncbi:unnamed protein product [Rhizopus stolonifer]